MTTGKFKDSLVAEMKERGFENVFIGVIPTIPNAKLVFENALSPEEEAFVRDRFDVLLVNKHGIVLVANLVSEHQELVEKPKAKKEKVVKEKSEAVEVAGDNALVELINSYMEVKNKAAETNSAGFKAAATRMYKKLVGVATNMGIPENKIFETQMA